MSEEKITEKKIELHGHITSKLVNKKFCILLNKDAKFSQSFWFFITQCVNNYSKASKTLRAKFAESYGRLFDTKSR